MNINYKVLCVDVDGTLASSDKSISAENIDAIQKAHQAGIKIVITSGRSVTSVKSLCEQCKIPFNAICLNGAYTVIDGTALEITPFSIEEIELSYHIIKKYNTFATFSTPSISIRNHDVSDAWKKQIEEGSLKADYIIANTIEEYKRLIFDYQAEILKISILEKDPVKYKTVRDAFEDLKVFSVAKSDVDYVDVTKLSNTKGQAVKKLAQYLGIQLSEVVCIGDNENDMEMIEIAGLGIAMGNAITSVKEIADIITASNNNNGVAKAIYKYLIDWGN